MIRMALVNLSERMSGEELEAIEHAIRIQLARDFCKRWDRSVPAFAYFDRISDVPAGYWPMMIADKPDQPGALGYHTQWQDKPFSKTFVDVILSVGGSIIGDPKDPHAESVATTLSHEVLETLADPDVNVWADGPERDEGFQYAYEVCDPVQDHSYFINVDGFTSPIAVSDFVLPEWFDEQTHRGEKYDHLGVLRAPFTIAPGGYMIIRGVRNGKMVEDAVFGEEYTKEDADEKLKSKMEKLSRSHHRLRGLLLSGAAAA